MEAIDYYFSKVPSTKFFMKKQQSPSWHQSIDCTWRRPHFSRTPFRGLFGTDITHGIALNRIQIVRRKLRIIDRASTNPIRISDSHRISGFTEQTAQQLKLLMFTKAYPRWIQGEKETRSRSMVIQLKSLSHSPIANQSEKERTKN